MASVEITISGVLYDKYNRTTQQVVLVGDASLTGLGIGGGPIVPPGGGPDHIWGPTDPRPQPPIQLPPGYPGGPPHIWGGGNVPMPTPPIVIPPEQVPPNLQPPTPPAPGSPTTVVPPPAGSSGWPVQPIQPPAYLLLNYPGIGPVWVAPPLTAQPKPSR